MLQCPQQEPTGIRLPTRMGMTLFEDNETHLDTEAKEMSLQLLADTLTMDSRQVTMVGRFRL